MVASDMVDQARVFIHFIDLPFPSRYWREPQRLPNEKYAIFIRWILPARSGCASSGSIGQIF
jgi:hypothetical protein